MDKSFNGLRYSSSSRCLMDDGGKKIRMCHSSTQIFLLLKRNLNQLVTREHLLDKVPTNGRGKLNGSDDSLNECIDEIRHVVGDDRLKTIPRVGYLLTPDTSTSNSFTSSSTSDTENVKGSSIQSVTANVRRYPMPMLLQDLVFNSQWVICAYQKNQRAWIGSIVLLAVILLSPAGSAANPTMGHMAFDRSDATTCSGLLANCSACVPSFWQTSAAFARSNWFLSTDCL